MDYTKLEVGTKIYYTGDMANLPARGEIVAVKSDKWYPVMYDIQLDNGTEVRIAKNITPANFQGIGRRFELESEREQKYIDFMLSQGYTLEDIKKFK